HDCDLPGRSDSKVELAIAVEVANEEIGAEAPAGAGEGCDGHRRLECTVAVAQKDVDREMVRLASVALGHEVENAIAVEVGGNECEGDRERAVVDLRLEGCVAIAEQHGDGIVAGHCKVKISVAIEVGSNGGHGDVSGEVSKALPGRCESSCAVAERDADSG